VPIRSAAVEPQQVQRLLPGVPADALNDAASTARSVTYRAGETIMGGAGAQWTPAVVMDGTVRLTIRAHDGREATLRLFRRGVMIGLVSLFDPTYSNPVPERSVVAVERTTLVFFEPEVIRRLGHRHCDFSMHLVQQLVDWGGALSDAAGRFAFMSVRQRVAAHLLGVAQADVEGGESLIAEITQQQLADAVGSVREVVARTLRELRVDGLISVSRARITILDPARLTSTAFEVA
jgi:CRP/FNR family cyclic AMP-dependent transcriptional regulator